MKIIVLAIFLMCVGSVFGQKVILTGTVYDEYGAVIHGATITAHSDVKGLFSVKTDKSGVYSFEIEPGRYLLTGESEGFKTRLVKDLIVPNVTTNVTKRAFFFDLVMVVSESPICELVLTTDH